MGYGASNEYMIFPILELIKKYLRDMMKTGELKQMVNGDGDSIEVGGKRIYYEDVLNALHSFDYELKLLREDPVFPNRLTSAVIVYGEFVRLTINLLRENSKLKYVKMNITILDVLRTETVTNPLGMSTEDFRKYVVNKRIWHHFDDIYNDFTNPQSVRDDAYSKMSYYNTQNQQYRNIYNLPLGRDLDYADLVKYLQNPLGMEYKDFRTYVFNKKIYKRWEEDAATYGVTDAMKDKAVADNRILRDNYYIDEDVYGYDEMMPYIKNPMCMPNDVFKQYVMNKYNWQQAISTDPPNQSAADMYAQKNADLRADYLELSDSYSYDDLKQYVVEDGMRYTEYPVMNILITLNRNVQGKLDIVTSETSLV